MRILKKVRPTAEQLPILTDAGSGFRLIRGAAGSGKTTVALLRLKQLCRSRMQRNIRLGIEEPVRVLVLTFNRTLRGYVSQLAKEQIEIDGKIHLTIETFGNWARTLIGQPRLLNDNGKPRIRELLRLAGIADEKNMEYFTQEIEYILGRFPPGEHRKYLRTARAGRGRAPAVPRDLRTNLLMDVVDPYESWKSKNDTVDWNDIALAAAGATSRSYDVVVVDETQDLSANRIRTILSHLDEDHVTTNAIGTDTDTIATMAGAVLGVVAKEEPPVEVLDAALFRSEGDRLAAIAEGDRPPSHQYPDLLHWHAPRARADALIRLENDGLQVRGLGPAEGGGEPLAPSKHGFRWQWLELRIGQTVLIKRREVLLREDDASNARPAGRPANHGSPATEAANEAQVDMHQAGKAHPAGTAIFPRAPRTPSEPVRPFDPRQVLDYVAAHKDDDRAVGRAFRRIVNEGAVAAFLDLADIVRQPAAGRISASEAPTRPRRLDGHGMREIADEPTGNLDSDSENTAMEPLADCYARGTTLCVAIPQSQDARRWRTVRFSCLRDWRCRESARGQAKARGRGGRHGLEATPRFLRGRLLPRASGCPG